EEELSTQTNNEEDDRRRRGFQLMFQFVYIEAGKDFVLDVANLEMDTPPDFQLSQLEFESQESFLAWGGVDGK
ncbi:hypothetical protein Tco_0235004, partial [Tanacetum coccineum]